MQLSPAVWPIEQVLAVVMGWAAKGVYTPAGTGHNVMLNADWMAEYFLGTGCNRVQGTIGDNKMGDGLNDLFLRFQIKR
ncbi:MAG: hypothetical protein JRE28_14470 [Deltaproteobacteria bacterium]|nr:hypothetical protein [Deltaproteobacteria bacterium]